MTNKNQAKKLRQGLMKLGNNHILSGVQDKIALAGAGCILHERLEKQTHSRKAWSE